MSVMIRVSRFTCNGNLVTAAVVVLVASVVCMVWVLVDVMKGNCSGVLEKESGGYLRVNSVDVSSKCPYTPLMMLVVGRRRRTHDTLGRVLPANT